MGIRFTRKEILERFEKTQASGKPILVATCGIGLIAKAAEAGGVDLVMTACTSKSRLMGLPTTPMGLGQGNDEVLRIIDEISNVVKSTPIIVAADALDPTRLDLERLLRELIKAGYSGVLNFPTMGMYGEARRQVRESVGLGFSREVEMIRLAHEMNILTLAYVTTVEDATRMVEAGADCICPHAGPTRGGVAGFKGKSMEEGVKNTQEIIEVCRKMKPGLIFLAHGGPFATPEDTEYLYQHTDVHGFMGASSIERIPIEKAVRETVEKFKSFKIGKKEKK